MYKLSFDVVVHTNIKIWHVILFESLAWDIAEAIALIFNTIFSVTLSLKPLQTEIQFVVSDGHYTTIVGYQLWGLI